LFLYKKSVYQYYNGVRKRRQTFNIFNKRKYTQCLSNTCLWSYPWRYHASDLHTLFTMEYI